MAEETDAVVIFQMHKKRISLLKPTKKSILLPMKSTLQNYHTRRTLWVRTPIGIVPLRQNLLFKSGSESHGTWPVTLTKDQVIPGRYDAQRPEFNCLLLPLGKWRVKLVKMEKNIAGNIGDLCQKEMSCKRVGVHNHKVTRGQCVWACMGVRACGRACPRVRQGKWEKGNALN